MVPRGGLSRGSLKVSKNNDLERPHFDRVYHSSVSKSRCGGRVFGSRIELTSRYCSICSAPKAGFSIPKTNWRDHSLKRRSLNGNQRCRTAARPWIPLEGSANSAGRGVGLFTSRPRRHYRPGCKSAGRTNNSACSSKRPATALLNSLHLQFHYKRDQTQTDDKPFLRSPRGVMARSRYSRRRRAFGNS